MKLKIIFYVIIYELCIWHTCYSQPWSQISTTGSIPELKNHSAVYDPIADRILVFGGRNANGLSSNELWALGIANYQWLRHGQISNQNIVDEFERSSRHDH